MAAQSPTDQGVHERNSELAYGHWGNATELKQIRNAVSGQFFCLSKR
jgi:hypothetical protein